MSVTEFFEMGGFGLYIWSSFGAAFLLLVIEVIVLKRQRKNLIGRLKRMKHLQLDQSGE